MRREEMSFVQVAEALVESAVHKPIEDNTVQEHDYPENVQRKHNILENSIAIGVCLVMLKNFY
jgi:hypothetical protein